MKHYVLEGKEVREATLMEWASFFEDSTKRVVRQETLPDMHRLSTVFLGIDHRFSAIGPPILFETMIFCPEGCSCNADYMMRYSTWEEAEMGHEKTKADWLAGKIKGEE